MIQIKSEISPCPQGRAWLAPESKDALDVSSEATLGLLLQLVLKGWESHVVEGQVKEQRLAWDGLESWWEVDQAGLLGDEGRVQAECFKPFNQRLIVLDLGGSLCLVGVTFIQNCCRLQGAFFRPHLCDELSHIRQVL